MRRLPGLICFHAAAFVACGVADARGVEQWTLPSWILADGEDLEGGSVMKLIPIEDPPADTLAGRVERVSVLAASVTEFLGSKGLQVSPTGRASLTSALVVHQAAKALCSDGLSEGCFEVQLTSPDRQRHGRVALAVEAGGSLAQVAETLSLLELLAQDLDSDQDPGQVSAEVATSSLSRFSDMWNMDNHRRVQTNIMQGALEAGLGREVHCSLIASTSDGRAMADFLEKFVNQRISERRDSWDTTMNQFASLCPETAACPASTLRRWRLAPGRQVAFQCGRILALGNQPASITFYSRIPPTLMIQSITADVLIGGKFANAISWAAKEALWGLERRQRVCGGLTLAGRRLLVKARAVSPMTAELYMAKISALFFAARCPAGGRGSWYVKSRVSMHKVTSRLALDLWPNHAPELAEAQAEVHDVAEFLARGRARRSPEADWHSRRASELRVEDGASPPAAKPLFADPTRLHTAQARETLKDFRLTLRLHGYERPKIEALLGRPFDGRAICTEARRHVNGIVAKSQRRSGRELPELILLLLLKWFLPLERARELFGSAALEGLMRLRILLAVRASPWSPRGPKVWVVSAVQVSPTRHSVLIVSDWCVSSCEVGYCEAASERRPEVRVQPVEMDTMALSNTAATAMQKMKSPPAKVGKVVDMFAGPGSQGITAAATWALEADVSLVELNPRAVRFHALNIALNGLDRERVRSVLGDVNDLQGSWLQHNTSAKGAVVFLANPPYQPGLPRSDQANEPLNMASDGGPSGEELPSAAVVSACRLFSLAPDHVASAFFMVTWHYWMPGLSPEAKMPKWAADCPTAMRWHLVKNEKSSMTPESYAQMYYGAPSNPTIANKLARYVGSMQSAGIQRLNAGMVIGWRNPRAEEGELKRPLTTTVKDLTEHVWIWNRASFVGFKLTEVAKAVRAGAFSLIVRTSS